MNSTADSTANSTAIQTCPNPRTGPLYGALHVSDFPVQAFVRNEPLLRRQAVAVLDGAFPLFTVVGTNAAARRLGVRTGMTPLQLEQFGDLHIRYRSKAQEDTAHHALLDCAHAFTPRVENTAPDTITLDLNGLSGLWGQPRSLAQKLLRAAGQLGLEVHVAIASNPDAAIAAARGGSGITIIAPGEEARKLGHLSLGLLDASDAIRETFDRWGLRTFGDLTALPAVQLSERLGQEGLRLRNLARGMVGRPLEPLTETPRFVESMELDEPLESLEPLTFILSRLLNQLCQRLAIRHRTTNEIRLTLLLAPEQNTQTPQTFRRTIQLPVPVGEARTLLKLLQLDLEAHRPPAPVSHVTVTAEPVAPRRIQNHLFRPETPEPEKLELTLARIGAIVGPDNIGAPAVLDSHRPDAFRVRRFQTPPPPSRQTRTEPRRPRSLTPLALRISRPPQPITVETTQGRPERLLFSGKTGKVVAAAGPWTGSGDWWRNDAWSREEWDVEVQTDWRRTLYRIYRDPRKNCWFIDATYD